MYDGPVPAPRWFKLVNTGESKRLIQRSLTRRGANVVSGVHCDPLDTFDIYRLEPVSSGGKHTTTKRKRKHNKKTKINVKRETKKKAKNHKSKKHKKTLKKHKKHIRKHKKTVRKHVK
jgi:hypothetical protein